LLKWYNQDGAQPKHLILTVTTEQSTTRCDIQVASLAGQLSGGQNSTATLAFSNMVCKNP
jgi:hypothetical protein